jgi:hypothetical protein
VYDANINIEITFPGFFFKGSPDGFVIGSARLALGPYGMVTADFWGTCPEMG